jgi:hypothetical protein
MLLASLALALGPTPSWAGFVYTVNGSGSDGPLSASADFTFGAGTLTVTLTNTLAPSVIRSAGQALSGIRFTLSDQPGILGLTSASGQLGDVSSAGGVRFTSGFPTRWLGAGRQGSFSTSGDTITLETIGGGKPTEMIAPGIANGGGYTDVNNGFKNFDPYVIGPATFTLNLSGVTANTTVTSAAFSFGTGPDTLLPGSVSPSVVAIPEPSLPVLTLSGLGSLCLAGFWVRWRRRLAPG